MNFFRIFHAIVIISVFLAAHGYAADTFMITKSCGGGFTATHRIYSINQDGFVSRKVISYVDPRQNKEEEIIGKINSRDAKRLYLRFMQIDFENIEYSHPQNISCSLGLTVNSKTHTVTWPGGIHDSKNIKCPEEIKPVLDIFNEMSKLLAPIVDPIVEKEIKEIKENNRSNKN